MISITLVPVHTRPGRYAAVLDDTGRVLCVSRQPIFDGARVLADEGSDLEEKLEARHENGTCVAWTTTVGEAAKWTVNESDARGLQKRPWNARPSEYGVPENGLAAHQATLIAPDPENEPGDLTGAEMQEAAE